VTISCQSFRAEPPERRDAARDAAPDAAPDPAIGPGAPALEPTSEHARVCDECATWARRWKERAASLASLQRQSVPADLEGRVAATLQAGHRQARAVTAVQGLARLPLPLDLEGAVRSAAEQSVGDAEGRLLGRDRRAAPPLRAPSVLERLVREELSDLPRARARRFLGSLVRLGAPSALEPRVAHDLTRVAPARARVPRGLAWGALAAGLLAVALLPSVLREGTGGEVDVHFRVVRADTLEDLDPVSRALIDAVSGGILSAGNP